MNSIEKALDCLKNGNRTWEAMGFLQESIKADELTQEVLRQLRAEREALTLRVEEQGRLLAEAREDLFICNVRIKQFERSEVDLHLKGKE